MKFSSLGMEALPETGDWLTSVTDVDTADFARDDFADVCDYWRGPTASRRGLDMSCFRTAGRNLERTFLRFGMPPGYIPNLAWTDDAGSDRLLYSLHHYDVSAAPYLINAVLPDTNDQIAMEIQVGVIEAMIRLAHAVRSRAERSAGPYRGGAPKDLDSVIGQLLHLRPIHLWLPCRVIATREGSLKPMTPPRTLPSNDKYARHVQPLLESSRRFSAMFAAATLLEEAEDQGASDLSVRYSVDANMS